MIAVQRIVVILLAITISLLLGYLLTPYFKTGSVAERSTEESTGRVQPISTMNTSSVATTVDSSQSLAAPLADSGLAGQSLELDRAHSLQIKMYGDRPFINEQYSFLPSERIFLVLEFDQLEAGEYYLSALWKSPNGQLINTSKHVISLNRKSPKHRSFFWLQLIKNGIITEIMTSAEYKGDIHGKWDAEIYLDGVKLTTQQFMVIH